MSDTATLPPPDALKPASEMAEAKPAHWPDESPEYRQARTALLAEEIELRRQIQRVAEQRRALPPGRWRRTIASSTSRATRSAWPTCSAGTTRSSPIPGCTAPSASGPARCAPRSSARSTFPRRTSSSASRSRSSAALRSRASSPSPASAAGGTSNSTRSSATTSPATIAARAMATKAPRCWSGQRDGDSVRLFWAAEGGAETADPGFDPHLAPDPTPLWNILDMDAEGRGTDWYPALDYPVDRP